MSDRCPETPGAGRRFVEMQRVVVSRDVRESSDQLCVDDEPAFRGPSN
jgi:hypothetical protein